MTIDFSVTTPELTPETIARPFLGSSSLLLANRRNKPHSKINKLIPEIADIPRVGAGNFAEPYNDMEY